MYPSSLAVNDIEFSFQTPYGLGATNLITESIPVLYYSAWGSIHSYLLCKSRTWTRIILSSPFHNLHAAVSSVKFNGFFLLAFSRTPLDIGLTKHATQNTFQCTIEPETAKTLLHTLVSRNKPPYTLQLQCIAVSLHKKNSHTQTPMHFSFPVYFILFFYMINAHFYLPPRNQWGNSVCISHTRRRSVDKCNNH